MFETERMDRLRLANLSCVAMSGREEKPSQVPGQGGHPAGPAAPDLRGQAARGWSTDSWHSDWDYHSIVRSWLVRLRAVHVPGILIIFPSVKLHCRGYHETE